MMSAFQNTLTPAEIQNSVSCKFVSPYISDTNDAPNHINHALNETDRASIGDER